VELYLHSPILLHGVVRSYLYLHLYRVFPDHPEVGAESVKSWTARKQGNEYFCTPCLKLSLILNVSYVNMDEVYKYIPSGVRNLSLSVLQIRCHVFLFTLLEISFTFGRKMGCCRERKCLDFV
jgi:hypothetical protein